MNLTYEGIITYTYISVVAPIYQIYRLFTCNVDFVVDHIKCIRIYVNSDYGAYLFV